MGYGTKRKIEKEQYSFYLAQTHPHIISILCVDKGYPDNIIHNLFNEIEAIEIIKELALNEKGKNLNCLSKIFLSYKNVLIDEIEDTEHLEITNSQTVY